MLLPSVAKSCVGKLNFTIEGAVTDKALNKFNLPAPLLKSQPASPISSDVDFNICFISSFVKFCIDNIKEAAAETNGAEADVPLIDSISRISCCSHN